MSETIAERLKRWRKKAGELSCKYTGVGPTGGFCLDNKRKSVGGNNCIDLNFAAILALFFSNATVTDFGCGLGQYGPFLRSHHVNWSGMMVLKI